LIVEHSTADGAAPRVGKGKMSVVMSVGDGEHVEEPLPAAPPLASPSVHSTIFDDDFEIGDSDDDMGEAGEFVGDTQQGGGGANERLPFGADNCEWVVCVVL
jgi:hypothetical protein